MQYDRGPNENKTRICRYFLDSGYCDKGDECPFSHQIEAEEPLAIGCSEDVETEIEDVKKELIFVYAKLNRVFRQNSFLRICFLPQSFSDILAPQAMNLPLTVGLPLFCILLLFGYPETQSFGLNPVPISLGQTDSVRKGLPIVLNK